MYGAPPDQRAGETLPLDFCELAEIEQPTGGKKRNDTCHPQPGYALITSEAYIFPMAIRAPVCLLHLGHAAIYALCWSFGGRSRYWLTSVGLVQLHHRC